MDTDMHHVQVEHKPIALGTPRVGQGVSCWNGYVQVALLAVLWTTLFYPVFPPLVLDWYGNSSFSYGFLIPILFGYLIWAKKDRIRTIPLTVSWMGLPLLGFSLILYAFGVAAAESFVQRVSMIMTLWGLVLFLAGGTLFREILFPLAFLFFMVPIPYVLFKAFAFHLRLLNAQISADLVQWMGIPVFLEGYFLHLPQIILEVADVCSGLASILSLLAIGALYAYGSQKKWLPRLILFLAVIPIVILTNNFRITLTAVLVYYFGNDVLQSLFHTFHGTVNFLLSVALLFSLGGLLRLIWRDNRLRKIA